MTGHLLGAAGAIEAIICVLSIVNDIVPPTINHQDDDMDENIDYNMNFTFNKAQERVVNTALSNTFGFGGHNACIILKKYSEYFEKKSRHKEHTYQYGTICYN
jgi:3-oxoacyl-[acyl-carrier-protein] synthase II